MAKTLTAKVKVNSKSAERALSRIDKKLNKINSTTNKTAKTSTTWGRSLDPTAKKLKTIDNYNKKASRSATQMGNSYRKVNSVVGVLAKSLGRLASAYLGVMGARAVVNTSDMITMSENKLNALNTNDNANDNVNTQEAMDKMYASAQRVRMGYDDMMTNVSKSMTLAGSAFQDNIDNAIRFQEIMAEAYTLGGATAAEQSSSMYQLMQALGSGILQGDELRSVREGAPLAYKEMEKFAQSIYNTDESLKELAADGKITSDIVVAAIMNSGDKMDAQFENTKMTFAQAFTMMKNTAIMAFKPVLQMLNSALNSDAFVSLVNGITIAIQIVAKVVLWIMELIGSVFNWFVENWYWVQAVVFVVFAAIAVWLAILAGKAIMAGISMFIAWLSSLSPIVWIIALVALLIGWIVYLAGSVEKACGIIVGVIMAAISVVWNALLTWVTLVIQSCILPLATAWDTFANFFGNLFNDPIASIIYAFEGLAQSVLSILETIANGIDAIFGSNLASAVQNWSSGLSDYADKLANKHGNGSYEQKSDVVDQINEVLHNAQTRFSWDTADAYNTGYNWGVDGANWIKNALGSLGDKLNLGNLPNADDYNLSGGYDPSQIGKDIGNIDDNTGSIADSMDLAEEDLEYLRKIAAMEWKKEFTTANIVVDMNNYNTVNGETDLDGIVTKLAEKLYEELDEVANGVYA